MLLPTPRELKERFPLASRQKKSVSVHRKEILQCLRGSDPRIILIIGPCSLHHQESALAFATHLIELQNEVKERFLLVMRAYIEKPRTTIGWKGALYDPHLQGDDLEAGLTWTREILCALVQRQVPLATEFLEPLAAPYFEDLISLGFIGSRTSASQIHRQLASSLSFPVCFKNSPDGNVNSALNGMLVAAHLHTFLHIDENGTVCSKTSAGNQHTFLTLRGADHAPNHDAASIAHALYELEKKRLMSGLIIDCSHGNSQKESAKQIITFKEVVEQMAQDQNKIRGLMLESHLNEGRQSPSSEASPYVSITDPCLSFETTRKLILWAQKTLAAEEVCSYHHLM